MDDDKKINTQIIGSPSMPAINSAQKDAQEVDKYICMGSPYLQKSFEATSVLEPRFLPCRQIILVGVIHWPLNLRARSPKMILFQILGCMSENTRKLGSKLFQAKKGVYQLYLLKFTKNSLYLKICARNHKNERHFYQSFTATMAMAASIPNWILIISVMIHHIDHYMIFQ